MVLAGVDFWFNNYGFWPWQAKPRPKMAKSVQAKTLVYFIDIHLLFADTVDTRYLEVEGTL